MGFLQAARAPILNDVSTDLNDPPAFVVARKAPLPDSFKPLIRKAYPDLKPLRVKAPQAAAAAAPTSDTPPAAGTTAAADPVLDAVTSVARSMPRWQVVSVEPGPVLEAVATTLIMRFKDDIVVRVRPEAAAEGEEEKKAEEQQQAGALRIDVRSRSRLGKGDLGANAARIREYLGRLREELQKRGVVVLE